MANNGKPIFIEPSIDKVLTTQPLAHDKFRLWTLEDFERLKQELDSVDSYRLLKDDEEHGYKLWVKSKGEGSGIYNEKEQYHDVEAAKSPFTRHKYTCDFDFPVQSFYDVTRDLVARVEWDARTLRREILNIFHTPDSPLKYQVLEKMIKRTGPMMADRDCVTLSAELWEGDVCYFFTKSVDMDVADKFAGPATLIRSNVMFLGMRLAPAKDGKGMQYSCITQLDPKGWIVSGLMNWATKFIPKAFRREMIHAVENRSKRDATTLSYTNYFALDHDRKELTAPAAVEQEQTQISDENAESSVMMDVQ